MRRLVCLAFLAALGCSSGPAPVAPMAGPRTIPPAKVYVVLWFDTEDYLSPADDDASLHLANFLTARGIKATFKIVGEKARVLEKRGRSDTIEALKKHEIGFHSNYHSPHPTPAQYLSGLGWDEGAAEFERREGPGVEDLRRIFGVHPTCYGQPGSSWGPQAFAAMKKWGMKAYMDAGSHVGLDGKPHYYCGLLTMYKLTHHPRTGLGGEKDLELGKQAIQKSYEQLMKEGGGIISVYYHPCEWIHKQFWDSIFKNGVNPAREDWQMPPQKTAEETKVAYETFEAWIRYIQTLPDLQFITVGEAAEVYRDRAQGRAFDTAELKEIAAAVGDEVNFQRRGDYALAPAEVLALLNPVVADHASEWGPLKSGARKTVELNGTPIGPTEPGPVLTAAMTTTWNQFARTAAWVQEYLKKHHRIPPTIWLGSTGVPPEAYFTALARVVPSVLDGKAPESVELRPATYTIGARVADDSPKIFGWLFPEGFHAPAMMELARRQAWTIKPAIRQPTP
ncbi:MAG TPA: polysaccharide deacetylase family protein [Planctomycetota bacterium]|nr:polysaccharide deacetylase family protein [Planctomycetota bacterium]